MAKLRTRIGEWSNSPTTTIGLPPPPPKGASGGQLMEHALAVIILDRAAREDAERAFREASCLAAEVHIPDDHWPPTGRVFSHCEVPGCAVCAALRSEVFDYEE
jgi:hypothetical protein